MLAMWIQQTGLGSEAGSCAFPKRVGYEDWGCAADPDEQRLRIYVCLSLAPMARGPMT